MNMKSKSIPHQIIGSFEDIGKSIITETGKVPESLVKTAFGPDTAGSETQNPVKYGEGKADQAVNNGGETLAKLTRAEINETIARKALLELSKGTREQTPESSIYAERIKEEELKKEQREKENEQAKSILLQPSAKKQKFDRFGLAAKQTKTERKLVGAD